MWAEVVSNQDFDYLESQIQSILSDQPGYNATSWARKIFGNGSGGYYVELPKGEYLALQEIQDLIAPYSTYANIPGVLPPNSFTALSITDDVQYDVADFSNLGRITQAASIYEAYILEYDTIKMMILTYNGGQVVIINLNDNSHTIYDSGFDKPWKPIYIPSRNELVFIVGTSADLFKISLTSNTLTYTTTTGVTISNTTSGMQNRCLGTDNCVYFGTNTDGRVYKYNPETNAITYLGRPHTESSTYVYELGADTFTYALLRRNGNYWVAIINNSTLSTTYVGSFDSGFKTGTVLMYKDGSNRFFRILLTNSQTSASIDLKYKDGGQVSYPLTTNLFETEQNGYLSYNASVPANWPSLFDIEANLENAGGIQGDPEVLYKEVGDLSFTTCQLTTLEKLDVDVQSIGVDADNNLLISTRSYGPFIRWDVTNDTIDQINAIPVSLYGFLGYDSNTIIIGGYANRTFNWAPNSSWEYLNNPFKVDFDVANAFYHFYYAKSGDWVYSAQEVSRNDSGSCICMYNPVTESIIVADEDQIELLSNYGVSYMFTMNGGDKLVFIGRPIKSAIYPRVFVYDISSNKNINELTPTTFDLNLIGLYGGFAFPVGTDTFVGMNANVVYKVTLSPFSIVYRNLPSSLYTINFYLRSANQKSDGKILFLAKPSSETYLYELDPTAFTAKRKSSNLGSATFNRAFVVSDDVVYFMSGDTSISQNGGVNNKYFMEKLVL